MQAVIDYDAHKYVIAAACEKRSIIVTHKSSGDVVELDNRTQFYGHWIKKDGGVLSKMNEGRDSPYTLDEFLIEDKQVPEPVEFALNTVKNVIKNVTEKLGTTKYYGYIGKGESWRVGSSTILKYKGNRDDTLKPLLLDDIEEYIHKKHNGILVRDLEADDWCVIDCHKNPDKILVGVDKDYYGTEVILFNPDKMEEPLDIKGLGTLYLDDKGDVRGYGRKFFYFQIMSGDAADNYKANSATKTRWGDKSAYKILEPCKTDKECWQAVVDGYKKLYPEPTRITGWRGDEFEVDWFYVLNENCTMAHMLRSEDDKFNLYNLLEKLEVK